METDLTPVYVVVPIVIVVLVIIALRLVRQRKWGYCKSSESLKGKTFLITGANSGIGFETAKALVNRDARVIFACRNIDSANEAIAVIRKTRKKTNGEMIAMQVDLGSLQSIRSFVEVVKIGFDKIDVLINNAGVAVPTLNAEKTSDGFEINFGVNHLGPFLLTNLLLDRLQAASPSRVVIVSSQLYKDGKVDLEDLNLTKKLEELQMNHKCRDDPAYSNSKLMNIYFGKALAEKTKDKEIDVFILCPGFTYTNLFRHNLRWYHFVFLAPIFFFLMRTPKQGAQTTLHCATESSIAGKSGQFYTDCHEAELKMRYDKEIEEKLWIVSEQLINSQMA